ncbi:MAG TPA: hypothetical protein PLS90_08365, partial [Candidatus Sumerlaeota bacterium]|nr:hypothetical protein [Candidatus Sumerlaeota bacterium]
MRADYADFLSGRRLGATPGATGRARFSVWAPAARRVELHLHGAREEFLDLSSGGDGLFSREVPDVPPGALYTYRLDGRREFHGNFRFESFNRLFHAGDRVVGGLDLGGVDATI